jgi:hypothetical protein
MAFPPTGVLHENGLTAPGVSLLYGPAQMWEQDASVMGWTCGYLLASAKNVAKFYWDLLGPQMKILKPETVAIQTNWTLLDFGWAKGHLYYAGGLMVEFTNQTHHEKGENRTVHDIDAYWGHGGETYGFLSD